MRIGLGVSEDLPVASQQDVARDCEAAGLDSLWTNEARGRDALLLCLAWGLVTERLEVGVGVVPLWTRSPAQLAMACATLQEATGGRFLLGLGVSHPATMGPWHGANYREPLTAARETLAILDTVEHGGTTAHDGEVVSSRSFTLAVAPQPRPARTYLAAMGPRMLALGGAQADGVLLNWVSPDEVDRARGAIHAGARDGGGTPDDVEVAAYVRVAVDADRDAARAALAREVGTYCALPAYADHLERQGLGTTVASVRTAYRDGGADAVPDAIADDVLRQLGWWGTPDDDPSRWLSSYEAAGLDHLVARVVVVGDDPAASIGAVRTIVASAV